MQSCTAVDQTSDVATKPPAEATAYFFSAYAYCCEFDDGAIILDLRNDTYVGIDAQHLSNLRTCIGNWPGSGRSDRVVERHDISVSESLIAGLLARGILTTSPTSRQAAPPPNPTVALAVPSSVEAQRRISLTHVAHFSVAFLAVVLCLRLNGLASLLDWVRRRQSSIHRGDSVKRENTVERLASFLWLRAWCYTAQRRCLLDSLVLSVYLTRGMVPCTFVIGVAIKPFLAHAWVQIGESVLNDTAEHVHNFKPILNIGGA